MAEGCRPQLWPSHPQAERTSLPFCIRFWNFSRIISCVPVAMPLRYPIVLLDQISNKLPQRAISRERRSATETLGYPGLIGLGLSRSSGFGGFGGSRFGVCCRSTALGAFLGGGRFTGGACPARTEAILICLPPSRWPGRLSLRRCLADAQDSNRRLMLGATQSRALSFWRF